MRALIVDPSAITRRRIERSLALAGLEPSCTLYASDGRQALTLLRLGETPDLILSTLDLPVMDALEFLERRQAEHLAPTTSIAILAPAGPPFLARRALTLGAHAYLPHPVDTPTLRHTLQPLLKRKTGDPKAARTPNQNPLYFTTD